MHMSEERSVRYKQPEKVNREYPEIWPGYETVARLGKGGYGTVWKVRKTDASGEYYSAVKKISVPSGEEEYAALEGSGYSEDDITSIFKSRLDKIEAEFKLMEEFQGHSNIVSYQEHMEVEHEDGLGWDILIRMELLTPLVKCYDHFSEAEVIRLGIHICTALETIERQGIIHRDIKPSNILYSEKLGYYKLSDFGIAKTMDHVTKGTMIGTADYIAPEVFHQEAYGFQADQYSLGLVLYWMLNKRKLPFVPLDRIPTDDEIQAAKQRRVNGDPLPAPFYGSEALKKVVLKAASYDPADRYPDIRALRRALEDCEREAGRTLFAELERAGKAGRSSGQAYGSGRAAEEGPDQSAYRIREIPSGSAEGKGISPEEFIPDFDDEDDDRSIGRFDSFGKGRGASAPEAGNRSGMDPGGAGRVPPGEREESGAGSQEDFAYDEEDEKSIGRFDFVREKKEKEEKERKRREEEQRRLQEAEQKAKEEAKRQAEEEERQRERERRERLRKAEEQRKAQKRKLTVMYVGVVLLIYAVGAFFVTRITGEKESQKQVSSNSRTAGEVFREAAESLSKAQADASDEASAEEAEDAGSEEQTAPAQLTATVHNGYIMYLDDNYERVPLGSSIEAEPGKLYFAVADPNRDGYYFKGWRILSGSPGHEDADLSQDSLPFQLSDESLVLEAVYDEWALFDWIPVLHNIDSLFTYGGKSLLEISESDMKDFYTGAGRQWYTSENGSYYNEQNRLDSDWWIADYGNYSIEPVSLERRPDFPGSTLTAQWQAYTVMWPESAAAVPIEDVNKLLPDSCTIRLGDSFDAVCDKLGADNDMVQQILSMEKDARERYYHPSNNQDESFSVYTDKLYTTDSRYYHFYLKNGSYHYTFTFTKNDDMLCCINVGADDVS